MEIQKCNRCLEVKSLELFFMNPRGKSRRKICKQCFAKASEKWRKENPKRHCEQSIKWYYANPEKSKIINANSYKKQNELREAAKERVLNDHPCIVCGETDHILLDFHHLDPSVKEYSVGSHSLTWRKMLKEISKCVVLCCRCHRKHHWRGMALPSPLVPIDITSYL